MYPFRNLVFEGGGVKGIAYVGAMQELGKRGILDGIERVGGASAGAIYAAIVGLNFSGDDISKLLWGLNFNNFLDADWGIIMDSARLLQDFGWYKGDYFRGWIAQRIFEKTGNTESTFADVDALKDKKGFKSMYFMGTNLSTRFSEIFSFEHSPRMCIADAVRISMSFPLFFAAKRDLRGDVYVDGGVLANYPIKLFDRDKYVDDPTHKATPDYYARINQTLAGIERPISNYVYNMETLGFRLSGKDEISLFRDHSAAPSYPVKDIFDYTWALIDTFVEAQNNDHLHSDDWQRTIYIDTKGVGTLDFNLSDAAKNVLLASGQQGAQNYFTWYDDPQKSPANRPQ